jgi:hypothetical protein
MDSEVARLLGSIRSYELKDSEARNGCFKKITDSLEMEV